MFLDKNCQLRLYNEIIAAASDSQRNKTTHCLYNVNHINVKNGDINVVTLNCKRGGIQVPARKTGLQNKDFNTIKW